MTDNQRKATSTPLTQGADTWQLVTRPEVTIDAAHPLCAPIRYYDLAAVGAATELARETDRTIRLLTDLAADARNAAAGTLAGQFTSVEHDLPLHAGHLTALAAHYGEITSCLKALLTAARTIPTPTRDTPPPSGDDEVTPLRASDLSSVSRDAVLAYLRAAGWAQSDTYHRATVWTKHAGTAEVLVPDSAQFRDWPQRIAELVQTLAAVEHRTPNAVLRRLHHRQHHATDTANTDQTNGPTQAE